MQTKELKEVIVTEDKAIPFVWRDETPGGTNLGHAEFSICPIYKRGKMVEYFVYARQQRGITEYWHRTVTDFMLSFNAYDGLEPPRIWMQNYCKEHKTIMTSLYAPRYAQYFVVAYYGLCFYKNDYYSKRG